MEGVVRLRMCLCGEGKRRVLKISTLSGSFTVPRSLVVDLVKHQSFYFILISYQSSIFIFKREPVYQILIVSTLNPSLQTANVLYLKYLTLIQFFQLVK